MLVISRSEVNALLPSVVAVPLETAPRMPGLAVPLTDEDPVSGVSAIVYRPTQLYRPWLAQRLGTASQATMRQLVGAMVSLMAEHGEIWTYLPTIAGREAPSSMGADRMLVISRAEVNTALPGVVALPLEAAPRMRGLAVPLTEEDPLQGVSAIVYRPTQLYGPWLVERIGVLSKATMRQVVGALVGYVSE
ncbi:hypothetical protein [Nocardia brasiliensis]|uniref:hypothetical protein n=1 Tax=Nocardia brasiliensis TaxID=37326 RepID=UPI002455E3CA|nr:hypothetical protein [Nocardia brasiliensis]